MRHHLIVAGAMLVGIPAAHADQCAVVTEAQASKAIEVIKRTDGSFASFCAPCRDKDVKGDVAKSLQVTHNKVGISLSINGDIVDLAYTYYAIGGGRFRNLAMAVGCEVTDVPEFVAVGKK